MSRPSLRFSLVLFLGCLCSAGCMGTGGRSISLNRSGDENEKLAEVHRSAGSKDAVDEIPDDLNSIDRKRPGWSRWWEKIRRPKRMTLPRTDKETLLTSTDEPDPTNF